MKIKFKKPLEGLDESLSYSLPSDLKKASEQMKQEEDDIAAEMAKLQEAEPDIQMMAPLSLAETLDIDAVKMVGGVQYSSVDETFYTEASMATTKDSGVTALLIFESEAIMRKSFQHLERGNDPAPGVGYKWEKDGAKFQIAGRLVDREGRAIGVRLRESKGKVFVEVLDPKTKECVRKVYAKIGDKYRIHLLEKDGTISRKIGLETFVREREKWRARGSGNMKTLAHISNLNRARLPSAGRDHAIEEISKQLHEVDERGRLKAIVELTEPGYNAIDGTGAKKIGYLATISPEDAREEMEVAIALTDESRALLARLDMRKRKKITRVELQGQFDLQGLLPFDSRSTKITANEGALALERVGATFIECIQSSLTPSTFLTFAAVLSLAIKNGGSFVQSINALMDLRHPTHSGIARQSLIHELEIIAAIRYVLKYKTMKRDKTGSRVAIWETVPILHRGSETFKQVEGKSATKIKTEWHIDPKFWNLIQAKRLLAIIDKSIFAADSRKEEWEIGFAFAIASAWSKGWLANENLYEGDGLKEWRCETLLRQAGLFENGDSMLNGRGKTRGKGKTAFRAKVRKTLEHLQRFGDERVETIGDFEIIESKSDPMEDKIIISPTPGQVEEMRLEIKGKAEETRIAAKLIPAKGKKATRPLIPRKTNP